MKSMTSRRGLGCLRSLALLSVALAAVAAAVPAAAPERGPVARSIAAEADTEARVIVKFREDATLMQAHAAGVRVRARHAGALSNRLGLTLTDGRTIGDRAQVVRAAGIASQDLADRLAAQGDVEYAVVDRKVHALAAPNDPLYPAGQSTTPATGQWYMRAPTGSAIVDTTTVVSSINAEAAWSVTTGSRSVVVAVLDTGVRRDHPDLASKLLAGYDFVSSASTSNDGDARDADPSDPGNPVGSSSTSSWHGTQTSGLVGAATNNGVGMASVGRDAMVLPVRVLGTGGYGYESDVVAAMLWAAGLSSDPIANPNPAKVVNLSLGAAPTNGVPSACSASYADAVRQLVAANVVVVAAAGNDGLGVGSPANCSGVIGVAGVRHAGTKVGYSDLGPEIAIAAPAGNCVNNVGTCLFPILTTSNSGSYAPVSDANGGSIYTGGGSNASLGTSFSAPLVAGTVALMLSANPALTPDQVRAALRSSARPFPTTNAGTGVATCVAPSTTAQGSECYCTTSTCGAGLLDAGAAVAAVAAATANIAVASTAVTVGTAVALDGSSSKASGANATITGYQWTLTAGSTIASFTSATNASTAALQTSGAGTVVVTLTVTDTAGKQATASTTLTVSAATTSPTGGSTSSGGSSGGGGALEPVWLIGWLAAIVAVWAVGPRQRRHRDRTVDRG